MFRIKFKYLISKKFKLIFRNIEDFLSPDNFILILFCISIIGFSFINEKFYNYEKIQASLITNFLAIIFYTSFVGLIPNNNFTSVRKTIDLIGAPFVIAALLLLNLTYLKIL